MGDLRSSYSSTSPRSPTHIHGRARPPNLSTSARWPPADSSSESRSMPRAVPMIKGNRPPLTTAPPPLPPPTHVPDLEAGHDLGWKWGNRFGSRQANPANPQSTVEGGKFRNYNRSEDDYHNHESRRSAAELDRSPNTIQFNERTSNYRAYEPYPGASGSKSSSSQLQGESQLQHLNRKDSSHAYDQQLLSSLGGPKTPIKSPTAGSADGSPTSRRPSLQSPKAPALKSLSISERSLSVSSDSFSKLNSPSMSAKWATSPQSQTGLLSPGLASTSASTRSFADSHPIFEEGSISSSMSSAPTREEMDRIGLRVSVPEPRTKRSDSSLSLAMSAMTTGSHESNVLPGPAGVNHMGRAGQDPIRTSAVAYTTSPLTTAAPPLPTISGYSSTSPYSPYASSYSYQTPDPSQHRSFKSPTHIVGSGLPANSEFVAAGARDGSSNPTNTGGLRHFSFDDPRSIGFAQQQQQQHHYHQHQPQSFPLHSAHPPRPRILLDEPSLPSSSTAQRHLSQLPHHYRHTSQSRQAMGSTRKRPAEEMSGAGSEGTLKDDESDRTTPRKPHRQVSPAPPNSLTGQPAFSPASSTLSHTNGAYAPSTASYSSTSMQGTMSTQTELSDGGSLLASLDPGLRSSGAAPPASLADVARQATAAAVKSEAESLQQLQNITVSGQRGPHVCECCPKKPKKFDTLGELEQHQNEKQYTCQYCHNRFKNKNEAERHQNSLHLRRHSWSCAALDHKIHAAFHPANAVPQNMLNGGEGSSGNTQPPGPQQSPAAQAAAQAAAAITGVGFESTYDLCGYCGMPFPNEHPIDWVTRSQHLTNNHKFGECNQSKKFFRADHFRQHLKHSHNGRAGKWTNMLEAACMREEPPATPEAQAQQQHQQKQQQHQHQQVQQNAAQSQAAQAQQYQTHAQAAAAKVMAEQLSLEEQLANATAIHSPGGSRPPGGTAGSNGG